MLEDSTVDWKEIRRKVKREEKIFVFIILGIIIVSIIDEVIAKSGYAFLFARPTPRQIHKAYAIRCPKERSAD